MFFCIFGERLEYIYKCKTILKLINLFKKIFGQTRNSKYTSVTVKKSAESDSIESLSDNTEYKQTRLHEPTEHIPDFDSCNAFEQIITIFEYTLHPETEVARKAAKAVHRLFHSVHAFKKTELYDTFRHLHLNIYDINKFDRFDLEVKLTLLGISSMNSNGYVREEALNRIINFPNQQTFPFILYRLTDWVRPIRDKAEIAIQKVIEQENPIFFIQNHKLIIWLQRIQRVDLSEIYNRITNLIVQTKLSNEQLQELDEGGRLFYYKALIKTGTIDRELLNLMLTDTCYLIRLLLIKYYDKVEDKKTVLIQLHTDKSLKVRQGILNLIATQELDEYEPVLRNLIFDISAPVRSGARKLLQKICDYDFQDIYKKSLYNQIHIAGSILGLSEVADKNEIPLIQQYLDSGTADIRTAALIAIYNLNPHLGKEKAYQILETETLVKPRKAAESLLLKQGIDFPRLRSLYDITDISGKKIILRLFNKFSGWSVSGDYLKALTEKDEKIQIMARTYLISWEHYTTRLATTQTQEDKNYVINCYKKAIAMGIEVPKNIPFIFGKK